MSSANPVTHLTCQKDVAFSFSTLSESQAMPNPQWCCKEVNRSRSVDVPVRETLTQFIRETLIDTEANVTF